MIWKQKSIRSLILTKQYSFSRESDSIWDRIRQPDGQSDSLSVRRMVTSFSAYEWHMSCIRDYIERNHD